MCNRERAWIVAEGNDTEKHAKSMPLEKALDDVIVAYGQNGEALRREQGYPLRLLVPGWQGVNNVKYLRNIKVVDKPYYFQAKPRPTPICGRTAKRVHVRISSWTEVADHVSVGRPSTAGAAAIIRFPAWPGPAGARSAGWKSAPITGRPGRTRNFSTPIFRKAYTRFRFDWNWDGSEAVIMSRCTNEFGDIQPTLTGACPNVGQ